MRLKSREKRLAERRSKDRIKAFSYPRVGGNTTSCDTSVLDNMDGHTRIRVQEGWVKERGVTIQLEIPPEPLASLLLDTIEKIVESKEQVKIERDHKSAMIQKLAQIASEIARRLDKKGDGVMYVDFGFEDEDWPVEDEDDFVELAERLLRLL